MKRNHTLRLAGLLALAQSLAACGNPYALKLSSANYEAAPMAGEITITDPKLYRREALINERREERTYLNDLIKKSETQKFQPEIVRQLEVVKMLALSLGVGFDPAAGKDYRRQDEKADIQQEMDVLKLQMQLDELKRDVELRREALAKKTDPGATGDPPTAGSGGDAPDPPATDTALAKAITDLQSYLRELASGTTTALTGLNAENLTNPIDEFNDRATYREMLNAARNANSLDELHDYAGSSLVRLNLTATVLPPMKGYRDSFGQLDMKVVAPLKFSGLERDREAFRGLYRQWLALINGQVAQRVPRTSGKVPNFELSTLGTALSNYPALLDFAWFEYSTSSNASCRGLAISDPSNPPAEDCGRIPVAVPSVVQYGDLSSGTVSLNRIASQFDSPLERYDQRMRNLANSGQIASLYDQDCNKSAAVVEARWAADGRRAEQGSRTEDLISLAHRVYQLSKLAPLAERQAAAVAASNGIGAIYAAPLHSNFRDVVTQATRIVAQVRQSACGIKAWGGADGLGAPQPFLDALSEGVARLYQIGPKQQVQIVSTQARAAEAFSLAAALSAKQPTAGLGLAAGANFSRSAVGRVDALERVPLVVGYGSGVTSEGSKDTTDKSFGWMMGPRASVDPSRQKLVLEQGLRPQDLSIDLIVPGWWPYLDLTVKSTWAPKWAGRGGKSGAEGQDRTVRVGLAPSTSDLDWITGSLLGVGVLKSAELKVVDPKAVDECAINVSVRLEGQHLWRAESVIIGGRRFSGADVEVLPDLAGVLVRIDPAKFSVVEPVDGVASARIQVLTPYGTARGVLHLGTRSDACKVPPAPLPAASAGGTAAGKPADGGKDGKDEG